MKKHKTMSLSKDNRPLALIATVVAVVEPVMAIPQAWEIWVNQSAVNVSFITWGFSLFAALVWLIYAISIKNLPLLVSSVLWVLVEGAIVLGIIFFS